MTEEAKKIEEVEEPKAEAPAKKPAKKKAAAPKAKGFNIAGNRGNTPLGR